MSYTARMRIKEIHVYQKDLPIVGGPYVMSTMTLHNIDTTIVKLVTESGIVGWGEVTPLGSSYQPQHAGGARAAIEELAPQLIGQNCLEPRVLYQRMDSALVGHNYAKAAIDFAVMDAAAKHYGVRMVDLIGGPAQEQLPAYYAISKDEPDEMARRAVEKADQGYKRLQIKCGGRDVMQDVEAVTKVWEKIGGRVKLVVDANRGMTMVQAKQLCLSCSSIPFVLEQPCNSLEEVVALRNGISHPVTLDENMNTPNDVLNAIAQNACDAFGMKLTRVGGINPMMTIRDICLARRMPHTVEDSWGGDIVAAACLQVAATVQPGLLEGVWTAGDYIEESYDPAGGIRVENAMFTLPDGPGLGIEPDETRIGALWKSFG